MQQLQLCSSHAQTSSSHAQVCSCYARQFSRHFSRHVRFVAAMHIYPAVMHSFTAGKPECMIKAGKSTQKNISFTHTGGNRTFLRIFIAKHCILNQLTAFLRVLIIQMKKNYFF
jgi:hypothetical protein